MSAYALYHAIFVCQCRRRRFLPIEKITKCNHFWISLDKAENPGKPVETGGKKGGGDMGKGTVFLLNPADILLSFGEACPDIREKSGLRNSMTEEAIQQVIHIVHIVVHNERARLHRSFSRNRGKIRGKNREKLRKSRRRKLT